MMLFHPDGKLHKTHLTPILVLHLLLAHFCRGESQLIGPSQPIEATLGDDIILPCHLEPAEDVFGLTVEWARPDLNPRFVYVWRSGQELVNKKHESFEGRTSLFIDELKSGNISLKISKVKLTDQGTYKSFIPGLGRQLLVQLVVGSKAVSSPAITLAGMDKATGGVVLQCKSKGWYPKPEVFWLDSEGNQLSAEPTDTVRGPDDLYTVSSRVTVEKRHSNSFTCRVHQKNINQTRETEIYIPDDFFEVQSSSSSGVTAGLAVGLSLCILIILILVFLVWRQNKISKRNKPEDQFVTEEEREREPLRAQHTEQMEVRKEGKGEEKSKHFKKQQLEEQQRREEAESRVKTLKEELETKKMEVEPKQAELQQLHEEKQRNKKDLQTLKEELEKKNKQVETKQAELQQLHEEKQRNEEDLQTLKEELEKKNKQLETIHAELLQYSWFSSNRSKKAEQEKAEKELQTLKKKLEPLEMELDTKIKKFDDKQAEVQAVQQLQDEIQTMETNLQTLMEDLESNNMELERNEATPVQSSSSLLKWMKISSRQKFQDEQQGRKEAEDNRKILEKKLQTRIRELERNQVDTHMQLLQETQKRQKAQREVDTLKNHSESKVQRLTEEKQSSETELKTKITELEKGNRSVNLQLKKTKDELQKTCLQLENKETENSKLKRDLDQKLKTEKREREKAEKQVRSLQEELNKVTSPASLSPATGPVVEVDRGGRHIRLKNTSSQELKLGGWKLQTQVNNGETFTQTFDHTDILGPKQIWIRKIPGYGYYPAPNLEWMDLKSWSSGDKLQVALISSNGDIKYSSH